MRPEVAAAALRLLRAGRQLFVVTGRETEEESRRDTIRAFAAVLGEEPDDARM